MGAKQSKRSVDISGKEAETAGEVAAAGAGGEGRMEQLGDADAIKPQANGDAHIHDTTEKEKQLDSGTPENEKDATTEKAIKELEEKEKEKDIDVPNGESESKVENGESTPDDGKKNKKEKVKKKWSLRSISFSRKEKPKQEKKQKDDDVKVPEEVAETTPEVAEKEVAEETKSEGENKDEKTPETPVTEPLTNGSSTPESPKLEIPNVEEPKNENECDIRPEPKAAVVEPEQLPINGLSLEESKKDEPQVPVIDSNKTEEPKVEFTETVPTPESPVKKEVCVDQTHLIEPTPPPLPANPPPSSVASFAATTMAPELSDTSLAKNVDSTETALVDESPATIGNTDTVFTQPKSTEIITPNVEIESSAPSPLDLNDALETQTVDTNTPEQCSNNEVTLDSLPSQDDQDVSTNTVEENVCDVLTNAAPLQNESDLTTENKTDNEQTAPLEPSEPTNDQTLTTPQDFSEEIIDTEISKVEQDSGICELKEADVDASIISQNELNRSLGVANEIECLKAKAKEIIEISIDEPLLNGEPVLTNGDRSPPAELVEELAESGKESPEVAVVSEHSMPSLPEAPEPLLAPEEMPESSPLPPSELCLTEPEISVPASPEPITEAPTAAQEPLPVADKITELLPEIPTVPELNTETETTTDVAVAN